MTGRQALGALLLAVGISLEERERTGLQAV